MKNTLYRTGSSRIEGECGKLHDPGERRHLLTDQQSSQIYAHSHAFEPHSFMDRSSDSSDCRPQSSSSIMITSSLTGAIDHVSPCSQHSNSPSPKIEQRYDMNMQSDLTWSSNHTPTTSPTERPNMPHHTISSAPSMRSPAGPYTHFHDYVSSTHSRQLFSPPSPTFRPMYVEQLSCQQSRGHPQPSRPNATMNYSGESMPGPSSPSIHSRPAQDTLAHEIRHLRKKVRDLELDNESARLRVRQLESKVVIDNPRSSPSTSMMGEQPSPRTPLPQLESTTFKTSWNTRTAARIRQFCSPNRAGNALCAWHDSRRERRAYPPRMAPAGHLNCGCTYEEALFEESLARHNVGSYHPGETVRMDPALRNPLLRLLQTRYAYRDGDFERDSKTGDWLPGEGPTLWELKAREGAASFRKSRGESERR